MPILFAAPVAGLITLIVTVVLILALVWVLYWAVNRLAPEPMRNVLSVIIVVFGALILIYYAAQFFGLV